MEDEETGRRGTDDPAEAFRRLDAADGGGATADVGGSPAVWPRLRRQIVWLLVAMVALATVGFGAGWIFAQTSGSTASRLVITERVVTEPDATEVGDADVPGAGVAPSSGESDQQPYCGVVVEPVDPVTQIAVLRTGAIILQYRSDDLRPGEIAILEEVTDRYDSHLLVAPNPDLASPIVATAWRHRLEMDEVERAAIQAFVDGYRDPQPDTEDCPV